MKSLVRLYHFVGSVYFALILLLITATWVVVGTFLESATSSHGFAAQLSYGHPLFALLILGFFVNILVSALRRWPFQPRHIPFLITHLALLTLLTGVLVKSFWGVQGHMMLIEGSGSHQIAVAGQRALQLESPSGRTSQWLLKQPLWGGAELQPVGHLADLKVTLREYHPHGTEVFVIHDADGSGTSQTIRPDDLTSVWAIADGFGGYAVQLPLTSSHEEAAPSHRSELVEQLRTGLAEGQILAPPLQMLADACAKTHQDFPTACVDLLYRWRASHRWLFPREEPLSSTLTQALQALEWTEAVRSCCLWASELLLPLEDKARQGHNIAQELTDGGWPLPLPPEAHKDPMIALQTVHQQLFAAGGSLPPNTQEAPNTPEINAHLLSAYLRAFNIVPSQLPPEPQSHSLSREYTPLPPTKQIESDTPLITFDVASKGQREAVTALYEGPGPRLRWPILDGRFLVRFRPLMLELPYHLRLREARKISYPNSTQPFSYEADLLVTDRRTQETKEVLISMNHVYETSDGYRFYLSTIAPGDESAARRVQLAVNRDPAKYLLTYPGGVLLTLGIVLLFTLRPYKD